MENHKRYTIIVSGKVQGVCYRANTQICAAKLGLCGYARNLANGTVEVVAEGELTKLATLLNWCKQGPALAEVKDCQLSLAEPTNEFTDFQIR